MTAAGLPRARAVLAEIDEITPDVDIRVTLAKITARSAHATAIATIELAAATQLAALATLLATDEHRHDPELRVIRSSFERRDIVDIARKMLSLPTSTESE